MPAMMPDVLALEAGEAVKRLDAAGYGPVDVCITQPPWPGERAGTTRVLRQTLSEDGHARIVVAYTRYEGRPRPKR